MADWTFADAPARSIEVAGATLSYRLWSEAGSSAPGLLFLHGFLAHQHWWDHIVPAFTPRWRVATMDFSGMGDSDWRPRYTNRCFADEILAVIEAADLAPATIVAHSFAGNPAAWASILAPEQIARLIIIDSRMMIRGVPQPSEADQPGLASARTYPSLELIISRYRLIPRSQPIEEAIRTNVARHSAKRVEDGWAWKFDGALDPGLLGDPDRWLPSPVPIPTSFFYGADSCVVSPETADLTAALLPAREAARPIAGADHHVLLEQPRQLIELLQAALEAKPGIANGKGSPACDPTVAGSGSEKRGIGHVL